MTILSPIDIAEIPNARSPKPGIIAKKHLAFVPLKTSPVLGPGTFDITTVAFDTTHIIIS